MAMIRDRGNVREAERIEMRARRHRIGRRAIAFLVNVDTVLARFKVLDVGDNLDVIANFGERNRAGDLTA